LTRGHETFNQRFDALFAEDCCDASGCLHYIRRGKSGMGIVCSYLKKLDWEKGFPLDIVAIKLQRLKTELSDIMYVSYSVNQPSELIKNQWVKC